MKWLIEALTIAALAVGVTQSVPALAADCFRTDASLEATQAYADCLETDIASLRALTSSSIATLLEQIEALRAEVGRLDQRKWRLVKVEEPLKGGLDRPVVAACPGETDADSILLRGDCIDKATGQSVALWAAHSPAPMASRNPRSITCVFNPGIRAPSGGLPRIPRQPFAIAECLAPW